MRRIRIVSVFLLLGLVAGSASAAPPPGNGATITVGPGKQFETLSQAAAAVRSGQTVDIYPGTYTECAVWSADRLTIEGVGKGVVIADRSCEGKALFVIRGSGVTVRNITFTGAHVPTLNGAGIRAEGADLTVLNSRFEKNQDGILAATVPGSTIVIRDSYFEGNGNCIKECAHGIYINRISLLRVEHCEFFNQQVGHHIKSRSSSTQILDNFIHDGDSGTASYLIDIPNGGSILISGNRLQKGPHSQNGNTAIAIGAEAASGVYPSDGIVVENNDFTNDGAVATQFVHNWSTTPAVLRGNRLSGKVVPLEGRGSVDAAPPR